MTIHEPRADFDELSSDAVRPARYKVRAADGRWLLPAPVVFGNTGTQLPFGGTWVGGVEQFGDLLAVPDGQDEVVYVTARRGPILRYVRTPGVPSALADELTVDEYDAAHSRTPDVAAAYTAERGDDVVVRTVVPLGAHHALDIAGDAAVDTHPDWQYEARVDHRVFGAQLAHLLPGAVSGVRVRVAEALAALPGVSAHPSLVKPNGPAIEAYVTLTYADRRTHLIPRGGRSRKSDPVTSTKTIKLAWSVPDVVAGADKAAAVASTLRLVADVVADVAGLGTKVCATCDGEGVVLDRPAAHPTATTPSAR